MANIYLKLGTVEGLSVNYLNQQLREGRLFGYSRKSAGQWDNIVDGKLAQHLLNEQLDPSFSEQCVLVGQSINLDTIHKIAIGIFKSAKYILVSAHHLHGHFSQQAVLLELFYEVDVNVETPSHTNKLVTIDALLALSQQYYLDCFEVTKVKLSTPGLIVMDMDSTIINMECIDEIAALAGVGDEVSALTERAMLGELDFNQSLQARLSCLKGIKLADLEKLKSRLPINPGFAETMRYLQNHGWVTCIASGGFTYFADYLKDTFELTYAHSNTLSLNEGALTGHVEGNIVNAEMKKQILLEKRQMHKIEPQQTIAIGDGANDLLMMQAAALGIAYKAKPKVQLAANANIHYCGFEGLLYCLQF